MQPKAKGALIMAALANGKVSNEPNKQLKNPKSKTAGEVKAT